MAGVLFLPVRSVESIPVPVKKPNFLQSLQKESKNDVVPVSLGETERIAVAKPAPVFAKREISFLGLVLDSDNLTGKYGILSEGGELSSADVKLYKTIFDLQARGQMNEADQKIKKLSDHALMGHILYQRYMHPVAYRSSYKELKEWLDSYADHPGANNIYKMALSRSTVGDKEIVKPRLHKKMVQTKNPVIHYARPYLSKTPKTAQDKKISRKIKALLRRGKIEKAHATFEKAEKKQSMDKVELDRLRANIASGFLYKGQSGKAYALAMKSAERSGKYAPMAGWVAGLALWQNEEYKAAARYFEITGRSKYASGWMASASAYWAARCHEKLGNKKQRQIWLAYAAKHERTFYGLMAVQALDRASMFNWSIPAFSKKHKQLIEQTKAGRRALALVTAGQNERAEAELMRLDYKGKNALRKAVLAYAGKAGLPAVAMRLGHVIKAPGGVHYDSALYPLSPWTPEGGYKVDPALVHAIIRQESRFETGAQSHQGALGLMQVMPGTASYITRDMSFSNAGGKARLSIPAVNVTVGQEYLSYLLKNREVNGDMVSLLVAYNAGPGNLARWKKTHNMDDPLLFIETIPLSETRDYVEKVLSNYWIYRLRAGEKTPTLAALSSGKPARYAHIMKDTAPYKLAANN